MKWFPYSQHFFREYEGPIFLCLQGDFIKKNDVSMLASFIKGWSQTAAINRSLRIFPVLISFLTGKV